MTVQEISRKSALHKVNEWLSEVKFDVTYFGFDCGEMEEIKKALEEVEQYRALEEQGLLLKLHCKVGDTVYIIAPKYKDCHNTYNCDDFDSDRYFITWCKDYCPNGYDGIGVLERKVYGFETIHNDVYAKVNSFGIKKLDEVFLTKEEAEAKLKELEGK